MRKKLVDIYFYLSEDPIKKKIIMTKKRFSQVSYGYIGIGVNLNTYK